MDYSSYLEHVCWLSYCAGINQSCTLILRMLQEKTDSNLKHTELRMQNDWSSELQIRFILGFTSRLAREWIYPKISQLCVRVWEHFHPSLCPFSVFSTYVLEFTLRALSPAVCRAFCCIFFFFFCSDTLSPLVSRISLTSPDSLPFKWAGLLLKGWEGAHHVKPDTHTADTPHACPLPTFSPGKRLPGRVPSDLLDVKGRMCDFKALRPWSGCGR